MSYRRRLKNKKPPEGWELIEEVVEDFEQQMKEAVNEEHEGKRKAELTWKIHRIHWEKNRFIYDLMYQRKVMSRDLVRPPGLVARYMPRETNALLVQEHAALSPCPLHLACLSWGAILLVMQSLARAHVLYALWHSWGSLPGT